MPQVRRSMLYVPGDNPRALAKAPGLAADVVVVDLEDAVAPDRKDEARDAARDALAALAALAHGKEVALRVNGADTLWHEADVALAGELGVAVLLPKVREAVDVERLAARLSAPIWPMMETAEGILNALAVAKAAAATGAGALVAGTNDLASELGATPGADRAALSTALQTIVLAARAAGLDAIDGVMNDIADEAGLVAEARAGRALGMTGKSVVHPAQVGPVNEVFAPSADEVARARAVVGAMEAAEQEGRSVATLDGRMVERLHADAARRTLALADAIASRA